MAEEGTCHLLSMAQEIHQHSPDRVPLPLSHWQHCNAAGARDSVRAKHDGPLLGGQEVRLVRDVGEGVEER